MKHRSLVCVTLSWCSSASGLAGSQQSPAKQGRAEHLSLPSGPVHVPTDEVASALSPSSRPWKERYRCDKPGHSQPVIMQCRTNRRAAWAAQIAQDAGLTNCFVYKQVTSVRCDTAQMIPAGSRAISRLQRGEAKQGKCSLHFHEQCSLADTHGQTQVSATLIKIAYLAKQT